MIKVIIGMRAHQIAKDGSMPYWTDIWQLRVFGVLVFERENFGSMDV